jgi:hypothetical protein
MVPFYFFYAAAQEDDKEQFLLDLGLVCSNQDLSLSVGDDFNLLRGPADKNKTIRHIRWNGIFNYIINTYEMRELEMTGVQFTWSNNHDFPTLEKLDRFLVS